MKKPTFTPYRAKDGFRWRLISRNNKIIAESGEAYTRKRDCMRAIEAVVHSIFDADIRGVE